jgi:UTP-glucose-1-phosphate uridylyltransferase
MEVHFCFENSTGQTQLSVMQVPGADISKYGVIAQGDTPGAVASIVE